MKSFFLLVLSLAILAAVVIGGAAATGHVKHECNYSHSDTTSSFGTDSSSSKSCTWKIK